MNEDKTTSEIMIDDEFWRKVFNMSINCDVNQVMEYININIDVCPDRTFRSSWSRAGYDYREVVVKSIMKDVAAILCQRTMPFYNSELNNYAINE